MGKRNKRDKYEDDPHLTEGPILPMKELGTADKSRKHGEPLKFDPNLKGPIVKRSCTDIICCLVFIVFVAGLGIVAAFAFAFGDPELLIYPADSDGNLCGFGNMKGKPNVFFFDLIKCARMGPGVFVNGCPSPQICVETCPTENFAYIEAVVLNDKSKLKFCDYNIDPVTSAKSINDIVQDEECPAYYFKSESILDRCVPSALSEGLGALSSVVSGTSYNWTDAGSETITGDMQNVAKNAIELFLKAKEYSEKVIMDVIASWWMLLVGLIISMVISFIWIILMRWIAGPMVWFSLIAFLGLFGFATYYCVIKYLATKDTTESFTIYMVVMEYSFAESKFWLTFGIIAAVVLAISLLVLLILLKRIRIAITMIEQGSKAVGSMMFTLAWPIIPWIFQGIVVAIWLSIAVHLASTGRSQNLAANNITFANGTLDLASVKDQVKDMLQQIPCDANDTSIIGDVCGYLKYNEAGYSFYLQIYNLFMLFWLVNFFIALGQMTLAGAFASYYWAFEKPKDIPTFPLLSAFGRSLRYHLGSLAFGSFIIAVVQMIRVFLEYLDHKLKNSENEVAKFFIKCLKCCFWCLEKFLRFLNKNAYIMIAIHGKNFCLSAKDAFMLLLRNVVRVVVLNQITDFLLFIGKLVIVGAVGVMAFFFFDGRIEFLNEYKPSLNFYLVPVVILILAAYLIVTVFFSVYEMAVDTIFLCFLEDLERNDGSPEKPYFMCKQLLKLLGKKNVEEKKS